MTEKSDATNEIFTWLGRIAFLSLIALIAFSYLRVSGLPFLIAFIITMFGSFLYIWYQGRLRIQGRAHPKGTDLLLDVSPLLAAMLVALYLLWRNFDLFAAAYR